MKYRPLDNTGDMTAATPCLTDHAACIASLRSRLKLFQDDWWESPAVGLSVPPVLETDVRSDAALQAMANTLSAYIAASPGVRSVTDTTYRKEGHTFYFFCSVLTDWSREETVSTEILL